MPQDPVAPIPCERLDLVPASLRHLEAELQAPGALAALLGVPVPDDWPPGDYDREAIAFFRARMLEGGPAAEGWYSWYGIARNAAGHRERLVAAAGYFGPPAGGAVEIGYSVAASARGRGYASELVRALVARAFGDPAVREVVAHTAEANLASVKVLERCGFRRAGPGSEPGTVRFTRSKAPGPDPGVSWGDGNSEDA